MAGLGHGWWTRSRDRPACPSDCLRGQELADAILAGRPMLGWDWVRSLAAADIAFASDVLGTGLEWTAVNGGQEADWFAVLRRLQSKLSHLHRGV